jgi:hypothetical protein
MVEDELPRTATQSTIYFLRRALGWCRHHETWMGRHKVILSHAFLGHVPISHIAKLQECSSMVAFYLECCIVDVDG